MAGKRWCGHLVLEIELEQHAAARRHEMHLAARLAHGSALWDVVVHADLPPLVCTQMRQSITKHRWPCIAKQHASVTPRVDALRCHGVSELSGLSAFS